MELVKVVEENLFFFNLAFPPPVSSFMAFFPSFFLPSCLLFWLDLYIMVKSDTYQITVHH